MGINRVYIEPPDVSPLPYGLLSVADTTEANAGHWMQGFEYESLGCARANVAVQPCDAQPGTNEVQTVTITGTPTGGTFTLSAFGETTGAIAYNATNATVQTALLTLSAFDTGDVVVTGGPGPGTPYTLTFGGRYTTQDVPQVTAVGSFTGGTAPAVAGATTTGGVRTPKTVTTGGGTVTADPITLYTLYGCRTVGDVVRSKTRAVQMLNLGEGRALERGFWAARLAGGASVQDLTGTVGSAEAGLATLEGWASDVYGGIPVIHVPRNIGSILGTRQAIERHGTHLETVQGALVASGGGYMLNTAPGGGAAAAGTSWMYATGAVTIMRGTATVQGPVMRTIDGDNEQVSLAERTFVAATECFIAAIRVNNV
ncbi:MAG TPA: hypothetical protein VFV76_14370 [Actinomycetes bacterium]|nr:hypothetical protein [Actinomycetes bacterium]